MEKTADFSNNASFDKRAREFIFTVVNEKSKGADNLIKWVGVLFKKLY